MTTFSPPDMVGVLKQLKLPLEIISLLLGVIIGCMTVWQLVKPAGDLVAEFVTTEARLPGAFLRDAKALPQNIDEDLARNKDFARLIPDHTRKEVVDLITEVVKRRSLSLYDFEGLLDNTFMFAQIRNEGEQPLREVKLGLRRPLPASR